MSICIETDAIKRVLIQQMDLATLADLSSDELQRHRWNGSYDESYSVELLRRALVTHSDMAWSLLQQCFSETLRNWIWSHPGRDVALLRDSEENYIAQTFTRFWNTWSPRTTVNMLVRNINSHHEYAGGLESNWYPKRHDMQRLFQKEISPLLVKKYHPLKIEQDWWVLLCDHLLKGRETPSHCSTLLHQRLAGKKDTLCRLLNSFLKTTWLARKGRRGCFPQLLFLLHSMIA